MRQGGRENQREIVRNREAIALKIILAPLSEGNHGTNMTPQEFFQSIASKWTRQPGDKRETANKIGTYPQDQVVWKKPQVPQTTSEIPPKMSNMKQSKGDPSIVERGTPIQRVHRSAPMIKVYIPETAENPVRTNIQGVGLRNL